jgi:hypothetical protein
MKFSTVVFSTVWLALIAGAGWYVYQKTGPAPSAPATVASDSSGRNTSPPLPAVQVVNGETVIVISPDMQRASHIGVTRLASVSYVPTHQAYATIVDLRPFFDLCVRMAAARAEVKTLTVQFAASKMQYDRSRTLFSDDRNVSRKSLQSANAAMRADEAKLESAKAAFDGLAAAVRTQFGDALERAAAKGPASDLLHRLQYGQASVVRVSLSASDGASPPERMTIDSLGGSAVTARKLSASPTADSLMPGDPWLYVAQQAIPAGTRTVANVPSSHGKVSALIVPQKAVVWYGGQTWAYIRTASDRFTRRHVSSADRVGDGFTVRSGFRAGDQVVTQGAQLLLSEELKPQGVATVCKDPPECDD